MNRINILPFIILAVFTLAAGMILLDTWLDYLARPMVGG